MPDAVPDEKAAQKERIEKEFKKGLEAVIREVANSVADVVIHELNRSIEGKDVEEELKKGMLPYLAAAGTLAFSGRDIDRDGVEKLVAALGIVPDSDLIDEVASLRYKNHIVYINALYYMITVGVDPSEEKLMRIVNAMDIHPDINLAKYVMTMYAQKLLHAK